MAAQLKANDRAADAHITALSSPALLPSLGIQLVRVESYVLHFINATDMSIVQPAWQKLLQLPIVLLPDNTICLLRECVGCRWHHTKVP